MREVDFGIFRENLIQLRKMSGKTAKELSVELGMRQMKRISDIEEGRGKPTLDEITATCDYFKVPIDDMLRRRILLKFGFE